MLLDETQKESLYLVSRKTDFTLITKVVNRLNYYSSEERSVSAVSGCKSKLKLPVEILEAILFFILTDLVVLNLATPRKQLSRLTSKRYVNMIVTGDGTCKNTVTTMVFQWSQSRHIKWKRIAGNQLLFQLAFPIL